MASKSLEESYAKYKDKNGKKARNLKAKIDSWAGFNKIIREHLKPEEVKRIWQ